MKISTRSTWKQGAVFPCVSDCLHNIEHQLSVAPSEIDFLCLSGGSMSTYRTRPCNIWKKSVDSFSEFWYIIKAMFGFIMKVNKKKTGVRRF